MPLSYAADDLVKARIKWPQEPTEANEAVLQAIIGAVDGCIEWWIGCAVGPSNDTSITLDGRDAKADGHMLMVPAGIRSLTSLTVDGSAINTSDVYLRPAAHLRLPGWPPREIWLEGSRFSNGFGDVVATASLGFAAIPAELAMQAEIAVAKAWYARENGQREITGTDQNGNPIVSRFFSWEARDILNDYRDRIGIKKTAVSVVLN